MALQESWHVRTRSRECAATQRAFTDGETIVTALYPDPESSGYLRRDFGLEAWGTLPGDDAPRPFSFWKSVYAAPAASGVSDPEEKLSAEEILRRLVDEDADHTETTRYILAVMLERRKLLRETDHQRTPHGILRVYEHRKTGEVFLVRDPDIPLSEVESVQQEVMVLLENNGRLPEAAMAEAARPDETDGTAGTHEAVPTHEADAAAESEDAPRDQATAEA